MSQHASKRIIAIIVALTMLLGSLSTAWAAPVRSPKHSTPTRHAVSHPVPLRTSASRTPLARAQLAGPSAESLQFSTADRVALEQRQAQAQHLKQFKGGDVVVIGTTAAVLILAAVLIIVLVH